MTQSLLRRTVLAAAIVGIALAGALGALPCDLELPEIVATVGDVTITSEEIESSLAARLRQLDHQRYELVEKAVEAAVEERLLALEAAARGISGAELLAREVEAKIVPPSDGEVEAFYRAHRDRLAAPGERPAPQIRPYLENLQRLRLRARLLAALRAEHGARILLGPWRQPVEVGAAAARGPDDRKRARD